jgi:cytochrome c-type biogenesis protein CcmH
MIVLLTVLAGPALAVSPHEKLADPVLEQRARSLSAGLRCMVCQNQSIDESDADLARDLRLLVRDRLKAGDSDNQVVQYLVSRYGQFVLLKPRLSSETLLLWGMPLLLLLIAGVYLWRKAKGTAPAARSRLTPAEEMRLREIMADLGSSGDTVDALSAPAGRLDHND